MVENGEPFLIDDSVVVDDHAIHVESNFPKHPGWPE